MMTAQSVCGTCVLAPPTLNRSPGSSVIKTVAVGHASGTPVVVSGDDNGTVLLRALNRRRHRLVRLDAPAGVNAIAYSGRAGWLTATSHGRTGGMSVSRKAACFYGRRPSTQIRALHEKKL
jgi:hypothetical protein